MCPAISSNLSNPSALEPSFRNVHIPNSWYFIYSLQLIELDLIEVGSCNTSFECIAYVHVQLKTYLSATFL